MFHLDYFGEKVCMAYLCPVTKIDSTKRSCCPSISYHAASSKMVHFRADITVQHDNAYTAVRATSQSCGDTQIMGVQNSKNPEPTDEKFGVGHYVGDDTRTPKFKTIGAFRHMCEVSPLHWFFTARCYASAVSAVVMCFCLSVSRILVLYQNY